MSSYKAFEDAMKNKGGGGTIEEALDALLKLLKRPDLVAERREDIDIDFMVKIITNVKSPKYHTMRDLHDELNGDDYKLVTLMQTYLHNDTRATRETTLPNVLYDQKDSTDTFRLVQKRYYGEKRLELLQQYADGRERCLSPIAYNNSAPKYETRQWELVMDLIDFSAAVWTIIGLILERKVLEPGSNVKKHRVVARFADKCMLSSLP